MQPSVISRIALANILFMMKYCSVKNFHQHHCKISCRTAKCCSGGHILEKTEQVEKLTLTVYIVVTVYYRYNYKQQANEGRNHTTGT